MGGGKMGGGGGMWVGRPGRDGYANVKCRGDELCLAYSRRCVVVIGH